MRRRSASHLRCYCAGVTHAHHGAGAAAIQQPRAHRLRKLRQRNAQRARRRGGSCACGEAVAFPFAFGHVDDQRRRGRGQHSGQLRRAHRPAKRRGTSGCASTTAAPQPQPLCERRGAPEALRRRVRGAQCAGRVGRRIPGRVRRRRGCKPRRRCERRVVHRRRLAAPHVFRLRNDLLVVVLPKRRLRQQQGRSVSDATRSRRTAAVRKWRARRAVGMRTSSSSVSSKRTPSDAHCGTKKRRALQKPARAKRSSGRVAAKRTTSASSSEPSSRAPAGFARARRKARASGTRGAGRCAAVLRLQPRVQASCAAAGTSARMAEGTCS